MISIIITSFKEPKTIRKAIESFVNQGIREKYEILVLAPDKETLAEANKLRKKSAKLKTIQDPGKGKPSALNLAFKKAKRDILILSDGDVYVGKNSVQHLIKHFKDNSIGAVTGRVIATNDKKTMFGYWAYLLTHGFHRLRLEQMQKGTGIVCSGYLYAIRKNLIQKIPEGTLADDAYVSSVVAKKGFRITYEPKAEVYVKYPTNLPDWIRQKKRTAGRYYQKNNRGREKIHSFIQEAKIGIRDISEIKSFRHIAWFIMLAVMRLYVWFRVFFDVRLWKRQFMKTWERVESTK